MVMHSCNNGGADFKFTGTLGSFLFCILVLIALSGFLKTPSTAHGKWFTAKQNYFLAVFLMATLDLPRYLVVAIDNDYGCSRKTWIYALHMLANAFFFSSYSIICSLWQETETIFDFFETTFYVVYTLLWPLYKLGRSNQHIQDENLSNVAAQLRPLMFKIKVLVAVVSISGVLRFIMLCIKISILDESSSSSSSWFTSPAWWVFDDFLPRLLPTSGFMLLMFGSVLVRHKSQVVRPVPQIDQKDPSQFDVDIGEDFRNRENEFKPHQDDDIFTGQDYAHM
eukprot:jgi/Bigna1/140100/aug1.54_g14808